MKVRVRREERKRGLKEGREEAKTGDTALLSRFSRYQQSRWEKVREIRWVTGWEEGEGERDVQEFFLANHNAGTTIKSSVIGRWKGDVFSFSGTRSMKKVLSWHLFEGGLYLTSHKKKNVKICLIMEKSFMPFYQWDSFLYSKFIASRLISWLAGCHECTEIFNLTELHATLSTFVVSATSYTLPY